MDDSRIAFAAHLRALMRAADVRPAELALACRVVRSTASRWVRGHSLPTQAAVDLMWSALAPDDAGWRTLVNLHKAAGGTDG